MNKVLSCVAVLGLLAASSSGAFARGGGGASHFTPAYAAANPGSSTLKPVSGLSGPAAYAPGQQMRYYNGTTRPSTGASVYAPGFLK